MDSLGTNANDYECEHLSFSELTDDVLGEYQLEKGSIIWKIQITELDDEEFKRNIIKEEIEKPINDFIDQIINVKVNEEDPNKRIIVIEKLVQDLIKKMERTKIEELSKDFIKRIIQIEELDNGHHEWKFKIKELCKDFTKQMTKIEELAKDPDNLKIEIIEKKLQVNKDLIRLFSADRFLHLIRNEDKDDINILAGKLLNSNDIVILTDIGIFIFHLNEGVEYVKLITLNYFHYIHQPKQMIN